MQWLAACRYIINSTKVFITKLAATARLLLLLLLLALSSFEKKKKTKVCCCLLCKDKTENHVWPCLSSGQQRWSNEKDIPSLVLTVALQQHLILHSLWKQSQLALEKEEEEHRFTWIVARSPKGPQKLFTSVYLIPSFSFTSSSYVLLSFWQRKAKKKREIKDSPHFLLAINQQIIGPL